MSRTIILIRGYSQSGKDFVGRAICQHYGYQRFAFADSLKRIVASLYSCPMETLHSQHGKQQICMSDAQQRSYRQILIDEALRLRAQDDTMFVRDCCQEIKKHDNMYCVITDWRYPIEYTLLKELFPTANVVPLHIIRDGALASPVNDISEHHLDDRVGDTTIINTMDDSVYQAIHRFVQSIHHTTKIP